MTRRALFVASLLLATSASAQAVPTKLSFTARLVDAGAPVQGNRDFVFKLYPTLLLGTAIWTETRNAVPVVDGAVNVELGASSPLTDTIFDGQTLYLEVTVGTTGAPVVLSPRTAVISVPYALRSAVAGQVGTLTPAQIQQRVTNGCGVGSAIQTINADGTVVCQAAGAANDAGVTTITNITAGAGLTGGGSTGNVTLSVVYGGAGGGNGTSSAVARSDHQHFGTYLPLGPTLACTGTDKVVGLNSSGSVVCGVDIGTAYSPATNGGLSLSGTNQFSLISCPATQVLVAGAAGTWSCAAPPAGVTSVGGVSPLSSTGGAAPSISLAACPTAGQIYKMAGGVWTCAADNDTTYSGTAPISVTGNAISLTPCPNPGEFYKIVAGAWRCLPDDNSGGTVISVGANPPLSVTAGAAPVLSLGVVPLANGGAGVSLAASGGARQYVKQPALGGALSVGVIAPADLPTHPHAGGDITSGTVGVAFGGTGAALSSTGGPGQVVKQVTAGGPFSVSALTQSELPSGTQVWPGLPTCPSGQYLQGIANNGTPLCVGPAPVDAIFNITTTGSGGTFAAVYVYCNTTSCNIPVPGTWAAGSSAGTVTVTRSAVGAYSVNIPWMGSSAVPQLTVYNGGPAVICKSGGFTGPNFAVNCYNLLP